MSSLLPTYARSPLAFTHGQGSFLFTEDGTPYLDFGAGIAVNALGHAHPALVGALTAQGQKLWHVSNLYRVPEQERLAEALCAASFAARVFFTNSGTEACELALKMLRKYWFEKGAPERLLVLTLEGAFHGRSTGAIAAAGSEKMTHGFGPLMPGFQPLPFGDWDGFLAAITEETAAVLMEPIQGEGGIRAIPPAVLKAIRARCDATGTLLVLDEIQSGMGRTGWLFAHEAAGITPDILMTAKGIGGGFPLGAVLASEEAAFGMGLGTHGSTYGGNPLACAVGLAAFSLLSDPDFLAEVRRKGALFQQGLDSLVARFPQVFTEVRGEGLMRGLRCGPEVKEVVKAAQARQLLTVPAADNVLRLLPPLNVSDSEIALALTRLETIAETFAAQD